MKSTVVTTTIYVPTFLEAYEENAKKFGHEVDFIVIGDRKTPPEAKEFCQSIEKCDYWDVEAQEKFLDSVSYQFMLLGKHIPENTIAKRNIGHLIAYLRGAESVIMLDDDNLSIPDQDFVKGHSKVGAAKCLPAYASCNGWHNVCDVLEEEHGVEFYARGFPPSKRWAHNIEVEVCHCAKVAVNAGLWTNDPDIDALTRLERRLIITGFRKPQEFILYPHTWSPWNCQNTAISRRALPSYFLSPYTGRHLDIWASYITTRIVEAQGEAIAFGTPLACHERSPHNLYKDLEMELPWIRMTDDFCDRLRAIEVPSTGYIDGLAAVIEGLKGWETPLVPSAAGQYLEGLQIWHDVFRSLQ